MAAPLLHCTLEAHNAIYPSAFEDKDRIIQNNNVFIGVHWTKHVAQNSPVLGFDQDWLGIS